MSDTIPQNTPQGKHYVYALAYPESMGGTIFYIGKGSGRRIEQHEIEARSGKDENPYKCNVIRKIWSNGEKVVRIKLAHFFDEQEAYEYEIALIFLMDGLTNLNGGGEGPSHSEETRKKMSESRKKLVVSEKTREKRRVMMLGNQISKGIVITEETRQKQSEARKGRIVSEDTRTKLSDVNKGKRLSEETKRKISESHKGKGAIEGHVVTEETKRKLSEANKGKSPSEETRRKLSEARKGRKPNKGHIATEETRQKMREAQKGRTHTEETKRKQREAALRRAAYKRKDKET